MFPRLSSVSLYATLLLSFALEVTASQPSLQDLDTRDQGTWTNAYCLPSQPQDLSAATVATCPSWAPVTCTAISEPSYCCNPSTYCARASDNSIGCCPWGQTCSPVVAGGGAAAAAQPQQHSTTWQQQQPTTQTSTVYTTQTHPYAAAAAPEVTTVYAGSYGQGNQGWGQGSGQGQWQGGGAGQQGQEQGQGGGGGQQYCSTLYAHGPNLPTTEAGTCGTILILNAAVKGTALVKWSLLFGLGWWCWWAM